MQLKKFREFTIVNTRRTATFVSDSVYSESCYSNVSIPSHSSVGALQAPGTVANLILSRKSWGLHHSN
jgi:hypothetical protein